jgi:hypothetical protein
MKGKLRAVGLNELLGAAFVNTLTIAKRMLIRKNSTTLSLLPKEGSS